MKYHPEKLNVSRVLVAFFVKKQGRNGCRQRLCPPDSLDWLDTGQGRNLCSNSPQGLVVAECRGQVWGGGEGDKRSMAGRGSWPRVRGFYQFGDLGKGKHD